jgi:hypothetical protein
VSTVSVAKAGVLDVTADVETPVADMPQTDEELLFGLLTDESPLDIRMGPGYCSCSCDSGC